MPRSLATCIFAVFIIWAFRRYSKAAAPLRPALWMPFIWVLINSSRALGYWFVNGTEASQVRDVSEGSFVDRNAYLCLIVIGIIILLRRRIAWGSLFSESRWLWIFYGYLLVSVLWSPYMFISFKRWFKDAGDLVMIAIILTESEPVEAIRGIFIRCAYVLIPLSVLFIKYYPDLGRYYNHWTWTVGYSGITTNKNSLGLLAMLGGLFLLWNIVDVSRITEIWKRFGGRTALSRILPDLLVLAMCLWILWIAQSATALCCFIIGAATFFGTRSRLIKAHLGTCLFAVGLLVLAFTLSLDFRGAITEFLGRNTTLTERTEIWERALQLETNPLIGAGFSSVWLTTKGAALVQDWGASLAHSHNGYLETYLNTGWIGVCLLLAVLFAAGRNATRHLKEGTVLGHLFLALFLSGIFYNYSEVTFFHSNTMGFLLWLLAVPYGLLAQEANRIDENAAAISAEDLNLFEAESMGKFESHESLADAIAADGDNGVRGV
jgi:exopolysaccharide production protein ExoQ